MPTYVIGDIHGCFDGLKKILTKINYQPVSDRLIFLGDLINKGPDSIGVLKWIIQQPNCRTVLGNHDLYILNLILNDQASGSLTAQSIINAANSEAIVQWLCNQPLIIIEDKYLFCHAGIHPNWSDQNIKFIAQQKNTYTNATSLKQYFAQKPWELTHDCMAPSFIIAALTEMRFLNKDTLMFMPGSEDACSAIAKNKIPWFDAPYSYSWEKVYFGHWARLSGMHHKHTTCLDGGYLYGNELRCERLEDNQIFILQNQ